MATAEPIAVSPVSPCEASHKPGQVDLTNARIGGPSREESLSLRTTGSQAEGSTSTNPTMPKETSPQEADDSNDGSDSADEAPEGTSWIGIVKTLFKSSTQVQQELENNAWTITRLTKRNKNKNREIERLKHEISVLRDHGNQIEGRCKDVDLLLREANARIAELNNDIARLSNALPESIKDDQYFNTKFSGVFFSLESWVLQYFMHSKIDPSNLQSLPAELIAGLSSVWGEDWRAFALEENLHTIEAVAILIIQNMILNTRILGILGDFFPAVEQHFGSCSGEIINTWRMQTTRMIVGDKDFPSRFERRVCEVTEHIEKLLGPLGSGIPKSASARMRRLRAIVEQAAELALECNKEPSAFSFLTYNPGHECQSSYMTDAKRTVGDEHLGADEACVKFTVSPAVLRAPKNAHDEPIVIMKARVVRHTQGPPGSEESCQTPTRSAE
ncbi:hypothetical protein EV426DRAFT_113877 [Tirmania nivea]|nr:hypothetical protein EV426DRAFT_113877 [Tirmania nivea]